MERPWAQCSDCQRKAGGKIADGRMCTMHEGVCPGCGETKTLVPTSDYNWPEKRSTFD